MKKVFLSIVAVATILTACKSEPNKKATETKKEVSVAEKVAAVNNVDTTSSVLNWKGTKPTGSHNGIVSLKNGALVLEQGKLVGGEFIVDMSTIKVSDIPEDNEANGKLEGNQALEKFRLF